MRIAVKLFAAARQQVGRDTVDVELNSSATLADLRQALVVQCPILEKWGPHLLIALDHQYAADDAEINTTSEVACFPPVSGG
jgi:molybdopterin synthase catalytic subunit/molybdopterin synthase sulfur carrier subunit